MPDADTNATTQQAAAATPLPALDLIMESLSSPWSGQNSVPANRHRNPVTFLDISRGES
jgi:hypothetical protein